MAARRPGPPPKDPEDRVRRNTDPVLAGDGWTEINPDGRVKSVPEIPPWVVNEISVRTVALYRELAALPQAVTWGPGDWLVLHASLPLLDRYLTRPGSESYKAWTSVLDPGLRITSDSMQKARMRVVREKAEAEGGAQAATGNVTSLQGRRERLKGA